MKTKTTFLRSALIVASLTFTGNTLSAQTTETPTLAAHYKFDNSLADETGTAANVLTPFNVSDPVVPFVPTYETGQDGTINGAISAFGLNDYLESASDFSISGAENRTMMAWIKLPETAPQTAIVGLGTNETGKKWTFGPQNARKIRIEINGKGYQISTALAIDTWSHVAVTFDNANATQAVKLYLNGDELTQTNNWMGNVDTTPSKLRVGNDFNADPANRGFAGTLDDLKIYSGAASDAFILAEYNNSLLSFESINSESFSVYPNPTTDRLNITLSSVVSVDIYNISGAKIGHQSIDGSVDMSNLATGVYVIKCNNAAGNSIATVRAVKN